VRRVAARVALALGLLAPAGAEAAFEYNDTGWEGTSELLEIARRELGPERVELVATLDYGKLDKRDGVLVLHPETDIDYAEMSAFLRAGGRVAVLDDHGLGGKFLERFQIHRVQGPLRPAAALRDKPTLAIAVPAVQVVAGQEQNRHPVVASVDRLVTNHATALLHPNLTPVLKVPALGEPDATLAVTGIIVNRGRLFAMGDPSALINLMLRYPGNRRFASGLVEYLVENDAWGERGGKLYLVSNRFRQTGNYGGSAGALGQAREYYDAFREWVAEMHRTGLPSPIPTLFAVLAGLGALGWAALAALRGYRRLAPRYASATPLVAQGGLPGRAAVLSAKTTDRALVLIELRSALLEGMAARLSVAPGSAPAALIAEARLQNALSPESLRVLDDLLAELGRAQNAILAGKRLRRGDALVLNLHKKVMAILAEIEERIRSS
jgi:hypothetical protein